MFMPLSAFVELLHAMLSPWVTWADFPHLCRFAYGFPHGYAPQLPLSNITEKNLNVQKHGGEVSNWVDCYLQSPDSSPSEPHANHHEHCIVSHCIACCVAQDCLHRAFQSSWINTYKMQSHRIASLGAVLRTQSHRIAVQSQLVPP